MSESETVLITGGTGFIGGYAAKSLLEAGHEVVSFDLRTESPVLESLGIADHVQTIRGDVTDTHAVFRAVHETGASRLIHLASLLTTQTRSNPSSAQAVNVGGTTTVFEAARTFEDQIDRVVWASSSAVYAPPDRYDDPEVSESDLIGPRTLYGAAKAYNERQAEVYCEEFGVSHVGLRPTLVYGPHRETGSAASLVRVIEEPAVGRSAEVGPADHVFDWVYVADAGRAFHRAAFADESALEDRVFNLCGQRATLQEVVDVLEDLVGEGAGDVTLLPGDNPWNHHMNMDAIEEQLGYEPAYSLREGVREYVNVVRESEGLDPV